MTNELEHIGQKLPYNLPLEGLGPLQERIRLRTTASGPRLSPHAGLRRAVFAAAAIVALGAVTAIWIADRNIKPVSAPTADVEQLLQTASNETLMQAAATNYDDLLCNQQL